MNVADVMGPWHSIEVTDAETGETRTDKRRVPQFLHDIGSMPWRDVAAQAAESIPPTPQLGVWRVWCSDEQLAALAANSAYTVLRSAEVGAANIDADTWPALAVTQERDGEGNAFPPLPASGWLEAGAVYQHGDGAVIVRQSHSRTEHPPEDVPALFMVWREDADVLEWIAGEQVQVGTRRTYEGTEYECLQSHVTEVAPPLAQALWRVVVNNEEPQPWVQPTGAHDAYALGDRVTHGGFTWESTINANVWAPGVYGWVQI